MATDTDLEIDCFDDLLSEVADLRGDADTLRDEIANLETIEEAHVDDFVGGLREAEAQAAALLKKLKSLRRAALLLRK